MKHYLLSAILLLAGIFSAQAEPVCYQAQLTDRNGDPSRNEAVTLQLTLLDADGATTYSESLAATTAANTLSLSELPAGVYLLRTSTTTAKLAK